MQELKAESSIRSTKSTSIYSYLQLSFLFLTPGLNPLHSVCILSHNCPEWFISDVAAIFCGSFACGLYPTNSDASNKFILNDSRTDIVVCGSDDQVRKILAAKPELEYVKKIVQIEGDVTVEDPDVLR